MHLVLTPAGSPSPSGPDTAMAALNDAGVSGVRRQFPMAMTLGSAAGLGLVALALRWWPAGSHSALALLALPAAAGAGALVGQWLAGRIDWDEVFPLC